MSKVCKDPILSALRSYERAPEQSGKKAVLLTPGGGYFLYGNRFCSIRDYELELEADSCQIRGETVREPLFWRMMSQQEKILSKTFVAIILISMIQ